MGKKNTLLYLEKELVERAKQHDINLSRVAESALKSRLFPYLSHGGRIVADVRGHLDDLQEENKCFPLPFRIERVEVDNIGPIDHWEARFDDFNAILGKNAVGKTTLLHAIAAALSHHDPDTKQTLTVDKDRGSVEVEIEPVDRFSLELQRDNGDIREERTTRCYLIDDAGVRLDDNHFSTFIEQLKELDAQITLTHPAAGKDRFASLDDINVTELG